MEEIDRMNSGAGRLYEPYHITEATTVLIKNDQYLSCNYKTLIFKNKISCVGDGFYIFQQRWET